ncbi:Ubiquitin carboxyl-terminal hydrolase 3 [Bagarius yarrelli]|uniref:Ubiquitin carboxyl-terminal hydrolase n=1 Tax=Bagarius yarrelli TaxID=175774 RepID=A0A556U452_BAGYA|nr:Ubiquitin carboxyl-terminal hydrolase 3 [Bagarius yarrelli]
MRNFSIFLLFFAAFYCINGQKQMPDYCNLPKDEGIESNIDIQVYLYYNKTADKCYPFRYKGEGGNPNRFNYEFYCMRNCSPNADSLYPTDRTLACHLLKAPGDCYGHYLRYYYDAAHGKCATFAWTGCVGNGNRFLDFEHCNATCFGILDVTGDDGNSETESDTPIVCRSNKSPWVVTCLNVHCGRYVNGHAKKHFEEVQPSSTGQKKSEKHHQHSVCMDCSSYSTFCYRCDDFVVNDTKLGQVQRVREHLQRLENSVMNSDRQRKRKLSGSSSPDLRMSADSEAVPARSATGLRNLGNTCFMNAILQSLGNIPEFSYYFKDMPAVSLRSGKTAGRRMYHTRSQGDSSVSLVEELRKTLCSLWQGNQTAFSPDALFYVIWKIMPSFRGYQQQDAHEFLRYLLDHLHRELQGSRNGLPASSQLSESSNLNSGSKCSINGTPTMVTDVFGGILHSEVNCLICGTESKKFDPFLDLSLDIPSQFNVKRTKDQEPGPTCTLGVENSPPENCLYDLTAVVVHHGSGVGSGHYTAYGLHEGCWYHFNDSTVTVVNEQTVAKAKAYILFYTEQDNSGSVTKPKL